MPYIRIKKAQYDYEDNDSSRYDDNFLIGMPKADMLDEIEKLADFIIKKVSSCNKSYQTTSDTSEKFDLLYNTIIYHKIVVLLLRAYITEDKVSLEQAKLAYKKLINPNPFKSDERVDRDIDTMMFSSLISFSSSIDMLSQYSDNEKIESHNQMFRKETRYVYKILS